MVDEALGHSLRIQGFDATREKNDVYLYQPLQTYNGRPLYVGQAHGQYVYFLERTPTDPKPYDSGWCLSASLGSGTAPSRMQLPTPAPSAAEDLLEAHWEVFQSESPARTERLGPRMWRRLTSKLQPLTVSAKSALFRAPMTFFWRLPKKAPEAPPKDFAGPADDEAGDECLPPLDPPDPMAPPDAPLEPLVEVWSEKHLQLVRVPHATGLLAEAIGSGDEATVRYLIDVHRRQFPQCRVWQYESDGFWVDCDLGDEVGLSPGPRPVATLLRPPRFVCRWAAAHCNSAEGAPLSLFPRPSRPPAPRIGLQGPGPPQTPQEV